MPRGLALYESIKKFHADFIFYVLTFDDKAYSYLQNLGDSRIQPISIAEYNAYFNTSADKFEDRKQYYFSATPNICLFLLNKYPSIDILLYLDADVFIFNSLDALYEEFGDSSVGICPHRLGPIMKKLIKNHGLYNVGVNLFRNSEEGKRCLQDWKNSCDSWYKGKHGYALDYFSDQIFLDSWTSLYPNLVEIKNIGVDVAPWNAGGYCFSEHNGSYYIDNVPVLLFHFSSLKEVADNRWNANSIVYFTSIKDTLYKMYKEYIGTFSRYNFEKGEFAAITLKNNSKKKLFYRFMNLFLNEEILMDK